MGHAFAAAVVALLCLAPHAVAQREQGRRLASRAAFAALDGRALGDSSAILPLDARHEMDGVMLDTWRWLDSVGTGTLGMPRTRIRKWSEFGSQAHPDEGILVDGEEVARVSSLVREQKGMGGVPEREIARRTEWVLRMLVAHEYGHLLQYRRLPRDSVERPELTRVVECGADILGGYFLERYIGARVRGDSARRVAREVARDFGYVIGSTNWLDGTSHPLGENRRTCIWRGIEMARDSATPADVVSWSQSPARELAGVGSVVDRNAELDVVRDTSVRVALVRLIALAERGAAGLRQSRGAAVAVDGSRFLLRNAMPVPWQCTVGPADAGEVAECRYDARDGALESTVEALLEQVRSVPSPSGVPWTERDTVTEARRSAVSFTRAAPAGAVGARVEIEWGTEGPSAAQLATRYVVLVRVRAAP